MPVGIVITEKTNNNNNNKCWEDVEKEEPLPTVGRSVPGIATVEISVVDSQETQTRAAI